MRVGETEREERESERERARESEREREGGGADFNLILSLITSFTNPIQQRKQRG